MFSIEQRDHVRRRVLEMAQADERVIAGALTGSTALGPGDKWSDIDVAFGIADGVALDAVLHDWTEALKREFSVLDHFDLLSGVSIYRVFLLPDGLEIDVAVTPGDKFGARGPNFRPLFGPVQQGEVIPPASATHLIGLSWHHVLHARVCIERHKSWQAEYWISEIRNHTIALICMRLGEEAFHARGIDRLPTSVTAPLAEAFVRSLTESELRRALGVATHCLLDELDAWNVELCARLRPLLQEYGAP